jgi:hypothetical protein
VVTPTVFINLDEVNAGRLILSIFPRYYVYTTVTAAIAADVYTFFKFPYAVMGFGLETLSTFLTRKNLIYRVNIARDVMLTGDEAAGYVFDLLHKLSFRLNAVIL